MTTTPSDDPAARPERHRIERYDPASIEPRWQARWAELGLYEPDLLDPSRPKYYVLTMYPYPSGDLHIGHWYVETPTDALARFRRMHGYNVLFPIGFDAFGLPAENAAIKNGIHPATWTMQNIEHMRSQLRSMGDRRSTGRPRSITATPDYYRWNQWLFLRFLEAGLAYRAKAPVDWCPNDETLAREQVVAPTGAAGAAARRREARPGAVVLPHHEVRRRAARLLRIDWPEPIKVQQTNWIGRSEGAEIVFRRRPTTTSPAATSCASSRPGPTRSSARRSWSWRPSTRWSRS